MPQFVQNIHIENFKSAKDVRLTDCKRINLLIGRPNVGKSNLLEALSLFCLPFLKYLKKKDLQHSFEWKTAPNCSVTVMLKMKYAFRQMKKRLRSDGHHKVALKSICNTPLRAKKSHCLFRVR